MFGGSVDLSALSDRIQSFFLDGGFTEIERCGGAGAPEWFDIWASRGGVLRTVAACRKYYHVSVRGHPASFIVSVDSGEHGRNAAAALLTCGAGLAGLAANARLADRLWEHVRRGVEELGGTSARPVLPGAPSAVPDISHSLFVRCGRRLVQQHGGMHRCTGNYKKDGGRTAV